MSRLNATLALRGGILNDRRTEVAKLNLDSLQLWQFPDEDEQIFHEAEAYRALPVHERLQRMMAVIELGLAMQDANPRRDVIRELRLLDEEEQREALHRLFENHEPQRDAVAGRG